VVLLQVQIVARKVRIDRKSSIFQLPSPKKVDIPEELKTEEDESMSSKLTLPQENGQCQFKIGSQH
jgi:hypothetical protein